MKWVLLRIRSAVGQQLQLPDQGMFSLCVYLAGMPRDAKTLTFSHQLHVMNTSFFFSFLVFPYLPVYASESCKACEACTFCN